MSDILTLIYQLTLVNYAQVNSHAKALMCKQVNKSIEKKTDINFHLMKLQLKVNTYKA